MKNKLYKEIEYIVKVIFEVKKENMPKLWMVTDLSCVGDFLDFGDKRERQKKLIAKRLGIKSVDDQYIVEIAAHLRKVKKV